jgi:hypothetical protein
MKFDCDQAGRKFESESRVADFAHDAIHKIREHVKKMAMSSSDPFLTKVRKRSKILDHISKEDKSDSVQSRQFLS